MSTTTQARRASETLPAPTGAQNTPPPAKTKRPAAPPPRPPRRRELTREQLAIRGVLILILVVCVAFLLNIGVYSHLRHAVAQTQLRETFRSQLAEGTAPVSEGTFDDKLLKDGEPVARIIIPAIGVDEMVVEGTSSESLQMGPGHRRDTVLPGQRGTSVVFGRATAYGGPFAKIATLPPGSAITVITGQGEQHFKVLTVRYAGDTAPAMQKGGARLQLLSARGAPLMPSGLVRVDADIVGDSQDRGMRQTGYLALPKSNLPMASDFSTVWMLVFGLQFLLAAELLVAWAWRKIGHAKTWVLGVPLLLLAALIVGDQFARLLPNLT